MSNTLDQIPVRLRVVPHFSSGIVERPKRERARKSPPHARKGDTRRGDFHARSCFARSTIPEENRSLDSGGQNLEYDGVWSENETGSTVESTCLYRRNSVSGYRKFSHKMKLEV